MNLHARNIGILEFLNELVGPRHTNPQRGRRLACLASCFSETLLEPPRCPNAAGPLILLEGLVDPRWALKTLGHQVEFLEQGLGTGSL